MGNILCFNQAPSEVLTRSLEPSPLVATTQNITAHISGRTVFLLDTRRWYKQISGQPYGQVEHRQTLHGHTGPVHCMSLSPDGLLLATGSADTTIKLWRSSDGTCVRTLPHTSGVTSLQFSPDGALLVARGADSKANLWALATGAGIGSMVSSVPAAFSPSGEHLLTALDNDAKIWRVSDLSLVKTLVKHPSLVRSVAWSSDGTMVVVIGDEGGPAVAKLWRVSDGLCVATLQHASAVLGVAFAASTCATQDNGGHDEDLCMTRCVNGEVCLWRSPDGLLKEIIVAHKGEVREAVWNHNGRMFATGGFKAAAVWKRCQSGSVKCLARLEGHEDYVSTVSFSRNEDLLITSSEDKTARVWRIDGSACIAVLTKHAGPVRALASPFGTLLATCSDDHAAMLWHVSDGLCTATRNHSTAVHSAAFSPCGTLLATATKNSEVQLYEVCSMALMETLKGHKGPITSVHFSPDGSQLATGSSDKEVRLWKSRQKSVYYCASQLVNHSGAVLSVVWSPDGEILASASGDATTKLWNVSNGSCIATLRGHQDSVNTAVFSPDGSVFATGSADTTVMLWRMSLGVAKDAVTLSGHTGPVTSAAFRPDGVALATGSDDCSIRVWRVGDGVCVSTLRGHHNAVSSVAFNDSSMLASSCVGSVINVWRCTADGDVAGQVPLIGHKGKVGRVVFSPDGTRLASCGDDGALNIWRVANGVEVHALSGHSALVTCAAFNSDGTVIATGCFDSTVKLWETSTGKCRKTMKYHHSPVISLTFHTDGVTTMLASGGADRMFNVFRLGLATADAQLIESILLSFDMIRVAPAGFTCGTAMHWDCINASNQRQRVSVMPTGPPIPFVPSNQRTITVPRIPEHEIIIDHTNPIGSGSNGAVYPAIYGDLYYVVKKFHIHVLQAIRTEIEVVSFLRHPKMVRIAGIVTNATPTTNAVVGLLMERCDGNLADALPEIPQQPQPRPHQPPLRPVPSFLQRLQWMCDIAEAVQCAHALGVAHGDLNQHNILITDNGATAKLTDFGCAFVATSVTATVIFRGTRMFIAPECLVQNVRQSRGDEGLEIMKAADIFAFGMTMWFTMFTATSPDLGSNEGAIDSAIKAGQRPPVTNKPNDVPDGVVHLIQKCWDQDPTKRPRIEDVVTALFGFSNDPNPQPHACTSLWNSYLSKFALADKLMRLVWSHGSADGAAEAGVSYSEAIVDRNDQCYKFATGALGPGFQFNITKVVMVSREERAVGTFMALHEANGISRAMNPSLRGPVLTDADSVAALEKLKQCCVDDFDTNRPEPLARIVLAWHGTAVDNVEKICRDGPRSLRLVDGGFFGAGSYFALEAAYAARYSRIHAAREYAVILFAISVSQVYPVTPTAQNYPPDRNGFSRFHASRNSPAIAMLPPYDAHFIPVKAYGKVHPVTGAQLNVDVDFQAVAVGSATGHELVVGSYVQCMPVAIVYFH